DRGRVVDRAAADGVDGDGHRGRATAVEGAEGAADVLLVGGAHALRGRRLHEPDAARQLVVEVDVGRRGRTGVGDGQRVVEASALGGRVGGRRGRQLHVGRRAP